MYHKLSIITLFPLLTSCGMSVKKDTPTEKNVAKDIPLYNQTPATSADKEPLFNPAIKNVPDNIASFIPVGYSAIDTTSGDLNLDAYPDMVIVLKNDKEDDDADGAEGSQLKRPLLLLIGQPNHSYTLGRKSDKAVYCKSCGGVGGDPFTGISIKNGYFSVEMGIAGGQHWQQIVTFKYDRTKSDWYLYKNGFISYRFNDSSDPNAEALVKDVEEIKTAKDFGTITFEHYDVYKEDEK